MIFFTLGYYDSFASLTIMLVGLFALLKSMKMKCLNFSIGLPKVYWKQFYLSLPYSISSLTLSFIGYSFLHLGFWAACILLFIMLAFLQEWYFTSFLGRRGYENCSKHCQLFCKSSIFHCNWTTPTHTDPQFKPIL